MIKLLKKIWLSPALVGFNTNFHPSLTIDGPGSFANDKQNMQNDWKEVQSDMKEVIRNYELNGQKTK